MNNSSKPNMKSNTDDDDNETEIKCEEPYEYPPVFCKVKLESNELTCGNEERHQSDPLIEEEKNNTGIIKVENIETVGVKEDFHNLYFVSCYASLNQSDNTDALNTVEEPEDIEYGTFLRVYGEDNLYITTKKRRNSSKQGLDILNNRKKGKNIHKSQGKLIQKTQKKNTCKSQKRNAVKKKEKPLKKLLIQKETKFYWCSHCYKCFTSHVRYMNHLTSHGISREEYRKLSNSRPVRKPVREGVCDKCGKSITLISNLKDHMALHQGIKNYQCDTCNKLFLTKNYLRLHMECHIQSINYTCDKCSKCYLNKRSFQEHLKTHNRRPKEYYTCEVCYKYYSQRKTLVDHMYNVHANMKIHVCNICDNTFTTPQGLRRHLLVHKGCRNYMCDMCKKQFSRKDNLRVHILSHEKQGRKKT